jgi:hypothetical protein
MLTSEFITQVKQDFPKWSRTNILNKLNEVQKIMLLSVPLSQYKVLNTTTGNEPLLTTVAGTYNYTLSVAAGFYANVWKVTGVHTEDDHSDGYGYWPNIRDSHYRTTYSYKDPLAMFIDGSSSSYAQVTFYDDPGSTTYYITCYSQPTNLTSESITITVKDQYHQGIMYEGVCGLIEKSENSGKSDRWEKFEQILLPRFWSSSNSLNVKKYVTLRGY